MRKELLKKRYELHNVIEEINNSMKEASKEQSFILTKLKEQKLKQYKFINNLLKVI